MRLAVAVILAAFAAMSPQVRDQGGTTARATGTISGRVELTDDPGRPPIRRATAALINESAGTREETATDAEGRFSFEAAKVGTYVLRISKPGFLPLEARSTFEVRGQDSRTVTLSMQRAGAIEGRFIDTNGTPLQRLTVAADRVDLVPAPIGANVADTDDLGRFRIHTLAPGRYRVYAIPPPPASGDRLFYPGTANPAEAATITVASGQTHDGLDITVPVAPLAQSAAETIAETERTETSVASIGMPSARISGRVTRADSGQPIAGATIQIVSASGAAVSMRSFPRTNSDGRFEFRELARGDYVLHVVAPGYLPTDASRLLPAGAGTAVTIKDGQTVTGVNVVVARASAIEGRVLDEFGDPAPGIAIRAMLPTTTLAGVKRVSAAIAAQISDDRGWFRIAGLPPADYFLVALPEPFERSGATGFSPTFFPGTVSFDAATPLSLVAGRDALDATFRVATARTEKVFGGVTSANLSPVAGSTVRLLPADGGEIRLMAVAATNVGVDGQFVFPRVPEGDYVLQVSGSGGFASARITVAAVGRGEVQPIVLEAKAPITARGRITFDGNAKPPGPGSVGLSFQPTDITMGPVGSNAIQSKITADWQFEIPNLAWHGIIGVRPPPGWALARSLLQGRDITDTPTDFQTADVNGIEIVLTSRVGAISGTVATGGQPELDTIVAVFGADSPNQLSLLRTFRGANITAQGTFTISGLVPGRYIAVAIRRSNMPSDVDVLRTLQSGGTPVTVTEGTTTAVTVKVIK